MREETKIDKDYMEALNLGYELAKELNLKSPMFKDLNLANIRMNAMQTGMALYNNEIKHEKDLPLGLDIDEHTSQNFDSKPGRGQDEGKGPELII